MNFEIFKWELGTVKVQIEIEIIIYNKNREKQTGHEITKNPFQTSTYPYTTSPQMPKTES
jgi:hypothetical protein